MKKYIYTAIAAVCGALNVNMMCLPSHNMVIDVIGVFALLGQLYSWHYSLVQQRKKLMRKPYINILIRPPWKFYALE